MDNVKNTKFLICEKCDYKTSRESQWKRHLLTNKHKNDSSDSSEDNLDNKNSSKTFKCDCGKAYSYVTGLYKHKKKFHNNNQNNNDTKNDTNNDTKNNTNNDTKMSDKEIIMMLLKDNNELKNMLFTSLQENQKYMMSIMNHETHNTVNNICGNTNKTFNLQVFLNETCKDAINMSDFVDQLQVSISDLETTGKVGYAEGISKVFIKKLDEMNYTDRPIHCSDSKRETLYIKENNQWSKDDEQKTILTKAIKNVANKNIKKISEWQKLHPDFLNPESKENDKYMQIVLNSMSGSTKEESDKNYEKIAKNVIKKVVIEK
jgi:hypothetical protein